MTSPDCSALQTDAPPTATQVAAPNPTIKELWGLTAEFQLPDGITVYGPDSITERNETYEIAEYAPAGPWSATTVAAAAC